VRIHPTPRRSTLRNQFRLQNQFRPIRETRSRFYTRELIDIEFGQLSEFWKLFSVLFNSGVQSIIPISELEGISGHEELFNIDSDSGISGIGGT